jgi:hypothetical protein
LPNGQVLRLRGDEYAKSIQLRQIGLFSAQVYSDLPQAEQIENGTPARDLKTMLNRSMKVRLVQSERSPNHGKRYLIIPFRWKTEGKGGIGGGVMPASVANWWKDQTPSGVRRGVSQRVSGTGAWDIKTRAPATVAQRSYRWGDRLTRGDMDRIGVRGTAARRTMNGMVHMRTSGGAGGGAKSTFLTFRTMMEGSSGWIVPAKPGQHVARQVQQALVREAEQTFKRAVEADIAAILGQTR